METRDLSFRGRTRNSDEAKEARPRQQRRYREANVFDAVAGRVISTGHYADGAQEEDEFEGHARDGSWAPHNNTTTPGGYYSAADARLTPQEVLFRRKAAPPRYQEKDIYFASDDLPGGGRGVLPDSDSLKVVHNYASHFYEAVALSHSPKSRAAVKFADERSMDETALLAFGILLEEASREAIRKGGDKVLTEARSADDVDHPAQSEDHDKSWKKRYSKRRKIATA